MCGIIVLLGNHTHLPKSMEALKARGPDAQAQEILADGAVAIGFTRLHVRGSSTASEQPYKLRDGRRVLCNGEIYNAEILIRQLGLHVPGSASDCAVIPALMEQHGMTLWEVARQLDGEFAIVVVDPAAGTVRATRDPYGVRPMFYGRAALASTPAALPPGAAEARHIAPGTIQEFSIKTGEPMGAPTVWHEVPWLKIPYWRSSVEALTHAGACLRQALEEAVVKRLATVRTIGVHLKGDLATSLIAAIAARRLGKRLLTFGDSSVAAHIGSDHRTGESNAIVLLDGLGADEVFGCTTGDLTFESAIDRQLRSLHEGALLESEEAAANAGMETRYPFLDRQFVAVARSLPTDVLRLANKTILRTAFAGAGLLPDSVLWAVAMS